MMSGRVTRKQHNSKMCLVCGLKNPFGLQAAFYEVEGDQLVALFSPGEHHQGYPNRLHGGIAAAVLDETIGRAICVAYEEIEIWGVTIEFSARYRKPVPLGQSLRVVGRIERETKRHFEGTGEILLADGSVAVEGRGRYLKQPLDTIAEFDVEAQEWRIVDHPDDPRYIPLPPASQPASRDDAP